MDRINLEPIDDKIVIKPSDPELVSGGGVIIPEGSQPEATSGTVVAVGPGNQFVSTGMLETSRSTMRCKVGDLVYYPKFGAHKLEYDGEEYVVIKEGDLFCREEKKTEISKEAIKEALADTKSLSEETFGKENIDLLNKLVEEETKSLSEDE